MGTFSYNKSAADLLLAAKADDSALKIAEGTIVSHTAEIAGLQTSIATKANATDVVALATNTERTIDRKSVQCVPH